MSQVTAIQFGFLMLAAIAGVLVGWITRGTRCSQEKVAVNAGWEERVAAQREEHARLVDQNKHLMQQFNDAKASGKYTADRVAELTRTIEDSERQREELRREIREIQDNLEADTTSLSANDDTLNSALIEKDNKIFRLSRELNSWQQRLPPLIERFRLRNAEAEKLEEELAEAKSHILSLQSILDSDQVRDEPIEPHAGSEELGASAELFPNEQHAANAPITRLRDNLRMIKGIGPTIERTLNELGFFRLSQIAEMSEYDIDRVASRLKGFRTRVYREDWIGQAKELQRQTPGSRY